MKILMELPEKMEISPISTRKESSSIVQDITVLTGACNLQCQTHTAISML